MSKCPLMIGSEFTLRALAKLCADWCRSMNPDDNLLKQPWYWTVLYLVFWGPLIWLNFSNACLLRTCSCLLINHYDAKINTCTHDWDFISRKRINQIKPCLNLHICSFSEAEMLKILIRMLMLLLSLHCIFWVIIFPYSSFDSLSLLLLLLSKNVSVQVKALHFRCILTGVCVNLESDWSVLIDFAITSVLIVQLQIGLLLISLL